MTESREDLSSKPIRSESSALKSNDNLPDRDTNAAEANGVLARLQQHVANFAHRRDHASDLMAANQELVFATLRAQSDVASISQTLRELSQAAEQDVLTKLPNRVLLMDRCAVAIAHAKRNGTQLALLFLDLNNFKQINDSLGHAVGDQALICVAETLLSVVRETDTVSRHGGDEFLILMAELKQRGDAAVIADKIMAALSAVESIDQYAVSLAASIGISIYPDDSQDADTLINCADIAMYRAKRQGFGSYVFYGDLTARTLDKNPLALEGQRHFAFNNDYSTIEHNYDLSRPEQEQESRHQQLRESNEQLLLAALNAQELQAAAEQAQRRQIEFQARVAHELRNPLMPLTVAAALLGKIRSDEPLLIRVQAVIERQLANMTRLVGDLLDVSRVSTGKLRIENHVVDLVDIVIEVTDAYRPLMNERQQQLQVEAAKAPLEILGDRVRLTQVLTNLLNNASKYTPEGGEVRLSIVAGDGVVIIEISDNGIGITAINLPHIFDPFVQDDHAVAVSTEGLGIGLTVVRELVEAHSGTVVAHSDGPGYGSQFVLTFPLLAARASK